MHLVIVDTAQIQPYIFGSNRLRENIGASHLVTQSTEAWAKEKVQQEAPQNNIKVDGTLDVTKCIENPADNLDAEVLYAGGGNFVVLFRKDDHARAFTRMLSRKALTDAPNLQLLITQESFDWGESLYEKVKATFKKLADKKRARRLSAPLLGLGVTVMCQSTGLPATQVVQPISTDPTSAYPASAEIVAKLTAVAAANQRLDTMFASTLGGDYTFPRDFDELGRTAGEHSFIAVIHADGNAMGQRILEIGTKEDSPKNRAYIDALRSFSEAVNSAAQDALRDTLNRLVAKIQNDNGKKSIIHRNANGNELVRMELSHGDGKSFLPFRPIVFGGDDVTFVCDGRFGLSLAIEYMRWLEENTKKLPDGKGRLTASSGVVIVKVHYPFARAYALADELCKSAKDYRREIKMTNQKWDDSCLDWHFALSGLSGGIMEIREREYKVVLERTPELKEGWLTLCPVTLGKNPKESQRSWEIVRNGITILQGETWAGRRNKVKSLRDALRGGPDEVNWFLSKYGLGESLPQIQDYSNFAQTGWWDKWCGYFNALELADWFISL